MKKQVVIVVGPTAVGKSDLSIELAQAFQGEIISGDSMQVYKELTIGTAKILEEEMQMIPHHCIDTHHYYESYDVKQFQEIGRKKIDEIVQKGKLPIVCGGTGLYIKSLVYDYIFEEEKYEDNYRAFLNSLSNDELYKCLSHVDSFSSLEIHKNNRKRIIRALEIAKSGKKKSEREKAQKHEMIYDVCCIGLTMDRTMLYERINKRVDLMMKQGLLEEIDNLYKKDNNLWNFQSFKSIGYREFEEYYQGNKELKECVELIKKNSRNFAKRQYTWFHNQMDVTWFDICNTKYKEEIFEKISKWYKK